MSHEVHPLATLFPMLSKDELQALAEDIKEFGLREPIILDPQERIIDGRNREAACEMAGVKARYETFQGDEASVEAYIWSLNDLRRHLKSSQRAMIHALAHPGHNDKVGVRINPKLVSQSYLIIKTFPELTGKIVNDEVSFYDVYRRAVIKRDREEKKAPRRRPGKPAVLTKDIDDESDQLKEPVSSKELAEMIVKRFADGVKRTPEVIAEALNLDLADVRNALSNLVKNQSHNIKSEKTGDGYRLFSKDRLIPLSEIKEKILPLIEGLIAEGKKSMVTMSPGTVARLSTYAKRIIQEWEE